MFLDALTKKKQNKMKIQEAINSFESLKKQANKKSEVKLYDKFLGILTGLRHRDFSVEELSDIENQLDSLGLNTTQENRKKHTTKALATFEEYLRNTFALTTKEYYSNLGVIYGSGIGVVIGVIFGERFGKSLGISFGIGFGMLIGLMIGRYMDHKAKAAGNTI